MQPVEIAKNIYWVGAIDWDVRDFHGYQTYKGTTYNAYLVIDEKVTLFDTVRKGFVGDLLECISQVIDPKKIDYLVVNHVEMDHSGSVPEIMEAIQPQKLITSSMGKKALLAHFNREDWPYEVVKSGDELSLGKRTVKFLETRMLHWPDSMFSYIEDEKLLISQDAFGQHWATAERFDDQVDNHELMHHSGAYYANILMLYSSLVQKLLADVQAMGIEINTIAPDHGLIWRSDPGKILAAYDKWSKQTTQEKAIVVYDTMWHSTEMMARAVAEGIDQGGVAVRLLSLENNHRSDVMTEMLDARAIVLGSATLNNNMLPRMADMLCYFKGLRPSNRIGAAFGSYGWGGEGVKHCFEALSELKFEMIDAGLKVNYVPTKEDLEKCRELGRNVAAAVKAASAKE